MTLQLQLFSDILIRNVKKEIVIVIKSNLKEIYGISLFLINRVFIKITANDFLRIRKYIRALNN